MARSSDVEYKMRMTQELKEKILESAKLNSRSMNADIVARLEKALKIKIMKNCRTDPYRNSNDGVS